jgi:hypothetical protein
MEINGIGIGFQDSRSGKRDLIMSTEIFALLGIIL